MAKWQRRLAQVEQEKKRIKKKMEEAPVIVAPPPVIPDIMCERIKEFAMTCFEDASSRPGKIVVHFHETECSISFSEFHCNPNISFDFLVKFSEYFNTKNINIPSVIKDNEGCESCGHGATWRFDLEINDIKFLKGE